MDMELSRISELLELSKRLWKEDGYDILTAIKMAEKELTKNNKGD